MARLDSMMSIRPCDSLTDGERIIALLVIAGGELSSVTMARVLAMPPGRMYPALHRLEREGRILSRWEEARKPGARPRLYRVATAEDTNWPNPPGRPGRQVDHTNM